MAGINAVPGVGNMGNGANFAEGSQQNQGVEKLLQEVDRKIKDLMKQRSNGGEVGDELDKLLEERKKLVAQMSQGAQGDQGAQNDQGGDQGQGQIKMPETQGTGKVVV